MAGHSNNVEPERDGQGKEDVEPKPNPAMAPSRKEDAEPKRNSKGKDKDVERRRDSDHTTLKDESNYGLCPACGTILSWTDLCTRDCGYCGANLDIPNRTGSSSRHIVSAANRSKVVSWKRSGPQETTTPLTPVKTCLGSKCDEQVGDNEIFCFNCRTEIEGRKDRTENYDRMPSIAQVLSGSKGKEPAE